MDEVNIMWVNTATKSIGIITEDGEESVLSFDSFSSEEEDMFNEFVETFKNRLING